MRRLVLVALLACIPARAQNVLWNSPHAAPATTALSCTAALLGGTFPGGLSIDMNQPWSATPAFTQISQMISEAIGTSGAYYATGTSSPTVNDAPYAITNSSFGGYVASYDTTNYAGAVGSHVLNVMAYAPTAGGSVLPTGTPPPVAMANASECTVVDGAPGPGQEFCIPASLTTTYPNCLNGSPSGSTAIASQVFQALEYNHSGWNMFDAKGALRQTSDNWPAYNASTYGYGAINYTAANSASTVYLQPPGYTTKVDGFYIQWTLYPYRQTRRAYEVVVSYSGTWPTNKNELTATDIADANGTIVASDQGYASDIEPIVSYAPTVDGTFNFAVLTTDGSGNYSAVQSFMLVTGVVLDPATSCRDP